MPRRVWAPVSGMKKYLLNFAVSTTAYDLVIVKNAHIHGKKGRSRSKEARLEILCKNLERKAVASFVETVVSNGVTRCHSTFAQHTLGLPS